ncbi:FliM/FliN family flagellar motor switch protein [Sphingomonas sp. ERG5]|uniref:FliM/FliN family flagellar motor switch protein n=1 Tax=Sphingomonas sp. ERG5 TaxID=1381597 RepID=UPI00068F8FAF|nr:FliM/FliN family flagellar motor switch protein [Sphingomonas sp. ERG5]
MTEQKIKAGAAPAVAQVTPARGINAKLIDSVEVVLDGYLGRATMTVAELGALGRDAVITLDAALNSAVDLRLNGITVARGELVAVGDNFAVRITEIGQ